MLDDLRLPRKVTGERADYMLVAARYLDVPLVQPGEEVWCWCAQGHAVRCVARSEPLGQLVWNVQVSSLESWQRDGEHAPMLRWPAQHVIPGHLPAPGPEVGAVLQGLPYM